MILQNVSVTVTEINDATVILHTESGEKIEVARTLLPDVSKGGILFIAADGKPLVNSEKQAKDVLNEILKH